MYKYIYYTVYFTNFLWTLFPLNSIIKHERPTLMLRSLILDFYHILSLLSTYIQYLYCMLSTVNFLLSSFYLYPVSMLSTVYILLYTVFCLLSTVYCLLSTVYCLLLSTAGCRIQGAGCTVSFLFS